jgi:teichuronic acid biosynthesis glycosyltransferase TuaG
MISILMPLYNGLEFLNESIGSVLNQSFTEWELLIGANGLSIKECNDVLKNISKYNNDQVHIIFYSFKGKCRTLNELIKKSQYEYICLLDADDYWMPQKLMRQLRYIERYDVVGTNSEYFEDKTGSPRIFLGKLIPTMFSYQNPMISSSIMMKKEDAHWDENWEGLDDYNLWLNLLQKGKTFYNIPQILVQHRIYSNSYYNNSNEEMRIKLIEEKAIKLTDEDYDVLSILLNNKSWEL